MSKFNLGEDPIICRLFKYFYNARPQLKRYLTYWPVAKVLNFLSKWHPASSLSLKQLTLKTIALIALSSSDRGQTLDLLDINNVEIKDSGISFIVSKKLKHHRKSINPKSVNCVQSDIDSLNVSSYVTSYMEKTSALRQNENGKLSPAKLFLSWATKKEVSKRTISRWLTTVLALSGIDTNKFKAHSYRGAGLSAAYAKGVPIEKIIAHGNWKDAGTFRRHYSAPPEDTPVGRIILENCS